jgi:hypothetical protein
MTLQPSVESVSRTGLTFMCFSTQFLLHIGVVNVRSKGFLMWRALAL